MEVLHQRSGTTGLFALILAFGIVTFWLQNHQFASMVMITHDPLQNSHHSTVSGVGTTLHWFKHFSQETLGKQSAMTSLRLDDSRPILAPEMTDVDRYHAFEKEQEWEWFDLPDFSNSSSVIRGGQDTSCSCFNPKAIPSCCQRAFRRAHKMGFIVAGSAFPRPVNNTHNWRKGLPAKTDYRDVVLVRDFYDALTSGYLYHKSGRECWLNLNGKQGKPNMNGYHDFDDFMHHFLPHEPPKKDRNLCRYLADEAEEHGMRVYMDYIFHDGYQDILRMWRYQQIPSQRHRIHFVCYNDFIDPKKDLALVEEVLDFLFPNKTVPKDYKSRRMRNPPSKRAIGYSGGHSTTRDEATRDRLRSLIRQLDKAHFSGMVEWAASLFPACHNKSSATIADDQTPLVPAVAPK